MSHDHRTGYTYSPLWAVSPGCIGWVGYKGVNCLVVTEKNPSEYELTHLRVIHSDDAKMIGGFFCADDPDLVIFTRVVDEPNGTFANAIDYRGQKYGLLTPIRPSGSRKNHYISWICKCDCGAYVERLSRSFRREGRTINNSCGSIECSRIFMKTSVKDVEVDKIFELSSKGVSVRDIAEMYRIGKTTVHRILRRDRYKHVEVTHEANLDQFKHHKRK